MTEQVAEQAARIPPWDGHVQPDACANCSRHYASGSADCLPCPRHPDYKRLSALQADAQHRAYNQRIGLGRGEAPSDVNAQPGVRWDEKRGLWVTARDDDYTAIRIRLNREKTARVKRTHIGQHTHDCMVTDIRNKIARSHEGGR
jgi:hypothetical protein